eukprot:3859985-Pyramimonas_sp.AAC.1
MDSGGSISDQVELVKRCTFQASTRARARLSREVARSAGEKMQFALTAFRGLRARYPERAPAAISRRPPLSRFIAWEPRARRDPPALRGRAQPPRGERTAQLEGEADAETDAE